MQSFPDYTPFVVSPEALFKGFRRCLKATHIFQPKYAEDSKHIRKFTKKHLLHFSRQIVIGEEEICMAILKDAYPRKLNQWVMKATRLKSQVSDALKEPKNSKDPSFKDKELKDMCDKIFVHMKDCPVEDLNDKPWAFIAPMHETDDRDLLDSDVLPSEDVENEVGSSDVSVRVSVSSSPGRREGKDIVTIGSESETVSFPESYGAPILKLRSENMGGEIVEGESSHAHDTSKVEDENKSEVIEEGDAPIPKRTSMVVNQIKGPWRRCEKMPIGVSDPNDASAYSSDDVCRPKLRVLTSEMNPPELRVKMRCSYSEESKHHGEGVTWPRQADEFWFTRVDESELGTIIPILATGEMSKYVDLRLEILSMPSSQVTFNLNSYFGLSPEKDKYLFSDMKRPETSHANGASLPECLLVNRRGCRSKEMPTADEWRQAGVVNLIDKIVLLQSEEQDCPNLVLLFLQRNGRLTHIPSSFFNRMPALRFLDLSDTRIKALPSSLFKLTELQVLLLRSCACLDSLPADVQDLVNMEVLDLLGTDLDLPEEIGELARLRHLKLSFNRPDYGSEHAHIQPELISSGAIVKLKALQALSIEVDPKDHQYWIRIVRDIIQHIGELKMLTYLQFYFPSAEDLKSFVDVSLWKEKRLRRFNFIVGRNIKRTISRVPDKIESKFEQHDRCLRFVNGDEVPEVMKSILKPVTAFYLDHHLEIQSLSEFDISNFKELKFCVLRECPNIQVMIIGDRKTESAFPNLECLELHYLWKLERIWEDPIPPESFQALKYMRVSTCGQLKYIASHSILQCLSNLETFIIEDCESLRSIVKENEMVKYDARLLPRLKELVLRHLPQLVALGNGLFPSEEIISIHYCPNLILGPDYSRIEWKKLLSSSYNCCNICNSAHT